MFSFSSTFPIGTVPQQSRPTRFYGASGAHIGREYDVQFHIASTETWNAVRASAYIRTREFLVRTNCAHSYTYPYVMLNYNVN